VSDRAALIERAKLPGVVLAQMAMGGELDWSQMWVAIDGAREYAAAIAAGDLADDAAAQERAMVCAGCQASTRDDRWIKDERVWIGWCGERLRETATGPDGKGPTCGCMVFQKVELTIDPATGLIDRGVSEADRKARSWGRATPAGKTVVGSSECPRKLW
jgi:hypothetical protein